MTESISPQPHLAFVFPGQGSQAIGMLAELAQHHKQVHETFAQASQVLGYDLWRLVQQGPESELNQTSNTQPAMLCAAIGVWRVWQAQDGPWPAWMAGHSLGEYSALVAAEALAFEDGIRLVSERGRLMQAAVPQGQGAMAAVLGVDDERVRRLCAQAAQGQVVAAVNFNAPGQVVIAGERPAVQRAIGLAREAGAKRAMLLPVSVPSHCALMEPAADQLASVIQEVPIQAPRVPVLHNVDVQAHQDPNTIRKVLVRQLYHPVHWVETIRRLAEQGVTQIIECGPGKVLTGLNKRIGRSVQTLPIGDPASLQSALASLAERE